MINIALVVGHEVKGKKQGAVNYKGETESSFNYRICKALQTKLQKVQDVNCKLFLRDGLGVKGVAKQVAEFNADLSIEFHFNSFSKVAKGCEALAIKGDEKSILFADLITDVIKEKMGIQERNGDGVLIVTAGANGYWNLKYIEQFTKKKMPKIIIEPVFANIRTEESQKVFEDEAGYVEALYQGIARYFVADNFNQLKKIEDVKQVQADTNPLNLMKNLIQKWSTY